MRFCCKIADENCTSYVVKEYMEGSGVSESSITALAPQSTVLPIFCAYLVPSLLTLMSGLSACAITVFCLPFEMYSLKLSLLHCTKTYQDVKQLRLFWTFIYWHPWVVLLLLLSTFHLVSFLGVVSFSATRQTSNSSESLVSLRCCKRPSFIPNGNRISLLEIDSRHARKTKFNEYMSLHEEGKSQLPLRQFQDA